MSERPRFLSDFPYVVLRVRCTSCRRENAYRIVRLVEKLGAGCPLERVLYELTKDCGWQRERAPRKYEARCLPYLPDLGGPPRPPDLPPALIVPLHIVKKDDAA